LDSLIPIIHKRLLKKYNNILKTKYELNNAFNLEKSEGKEQVTSDVIDSYYRE
jgi:hypothetical protein